MILLALLAALGADFPTEAQLARERYRKAIVAARTEYTNELQTILEETTKKGDLDAANVVKQEINQIAAAGSVQAREFTGSWRLVFAPDDVRDYRIERSGRVTWVRTGKPAVNARLKFVDGQVYLSLVDSEIQRLTLVGEKLFAEHFRPTKPDMPINVGVAHRR